MTTRPAAGRQGFAFPPALVYFVFLASGAAGLVAEVSWSRQVGLAVGNTAPAVAMVLAAYFTGLAVGQALGSRLVPQFGPLFAYGLCELLAAAWGGVIPALLSWVAAPHASDPAGHLGWGAGTAVQNVWCFLILLPATVPLGATFPLMAAHLSVRGPDAGRRVALAYAANTLGGLVGVVCATAVLLVAVGVTGCSFLAAGLCGACGFTACGMAVGESRRATPRPPPAPEAGGTGRDRGTAGWWAAVAAASGFGTLGLEVLYTRMFALVFHNSTYTFGAVVAVFLAGLGLGAGVVAAAGRRVPPATLAVLASGLGAVAVPTSVVLFVRLTGLDYYTAGDTFAGYLAGVFGLVAVVVLPPVTLLGVALPAAFAAAAPGGRAAGRLAATNTLAAAAGAAAAGALAVPWLGLWGAFGLLATILALPAAAALARQGRGTPAGGLGVALAVAVVVTASAPREPAAHGVGRGEEIVRRWEGAYGWIDVVRTRSDGSLRVRENLHYRHGSTGVNAAREFRQGRLPLLLHPRPADVAFLGLGTGMTAAAAVADSDVDRAVVVELIPEVVESARLLAAANRGVVDHPKVEVVVDDARHHLRRTARRFDVIVSDLFVPWESRAGYLFTVEHYADVRRCLRPGGLFCQWVALYQVGPAEFELIADSFAAVFPGTTLWWGQFDGRYGIVALIGGDGPLDVEPAGLTARWGASGEPPGGSDPDLASPAELPGLFLGDWPLRPGRRLNTDEHPWLEFTAPASQRAGRTLMGPQLRVYLDDVFARLPAAGVRFGGPLGRTTAAGRRAAQRLALFGPDGE